MRRSLGPLRFARVGPICDFGTSTFVYPRLQRVGSSALAQTVTSTSADRMMTNNSLA